MKKIYTFVICLCVFAYTHNVFSGSCLNGYAVVKHNIDLSFNMDNVEYPSVIETQSKSITNTAFIFPDRDGNCKNGYQEFTVSSDYIYPLVEVIRLCPSGQYLNNGTCTSYSNGRCPEGMKNTTLRASSFAIKTGDTCPSNYIQETISNIEYVCDTYENHIDSNTQACVMMCNTGNVFTELNTCASLCAGRHKLMTSTGLEIPMYSTKQITPSINIKMGENICYVNLLSGISNNAINVSYDGETYHTVK